MSLHDAYKHVQYCRNIICPNIGFFQQMIDLEHKVRFFLIPRSGSDFHSSRQSRRIGTAHCILRLMAGIPFGSILHRASFNSDQSHDLSGSHKYLIHLRRSRVSPGPLLSLPGVLPNSWCSNRVFFSALRREDCAHHRADTRRQSGRRGVERALPGNDGQPQRNRSALCEILQSTSRIGEFYRYQKPSPSVEGRLFQRKIGVWPSWTEISALSEVSRPPLADSESSFVMFWEQLSLTVGREGVILDG